MIKKKKKKVLIKKTKCVMWPTFTWFHCGWLSRRHVQHVDHYSVNEGKHCIIIFSAVYTVKSDKRSAQ